MDAENTHQVYDWLWTSGQLSQRDIASLPTLGIEAVVNLALQEDVDVVGVSSLATDHLLLPQLMAALGEAGLGHVRVVVGGIVPDEDERTLLHAGVARVFHPGASREAIVAEVARLAADARAETS